MLSAVRNRTRWFVLLMMCMVTYCAPSVAQAPTEKPDPQPLRFGPFVVSGSLRVRAEAYDWFAAPPYSNDYGFVHSLLRVNFAVERKKWMFDAELAQPSVLGAPDKAIAPGAQGQLGTGASYFAANGKERSAAFVYPSKFFVRWKDLGAKEGNQLTLGRFEFIDGTETAPKDKTLAALKTMRIAHRLIGNFAWSMAGRSEDGLTLSIAGPSQGSFTFAGARPTRGVYQVDGLGELDIAWEYGAYTQPFQVAKNPGELRVFGIGYQDVRTDIKTDNRPLAVRQGADHLQDINIGTFGAHYIQVVNTKSAGKWDLLLWGAGQTGAWGLQGQRAGAGALELGWQPEAKTLKPWFRMGYFISSGDGKPNDNRHETFFQLLPTPRWYARYPFYNLENIQDVSATAIFRPGTKWNLRSEFHNLSLTSRNDLWYQGGGAYQPHTFGYAGRPSGGHKALANLLDISADYQLRNNIGVTLYFAQAWGQSVMRAIYPAGASSQFGYAEFNYRF